MINKIKEKYLEYSDKYEQYPENKIYRYKKKIFTQT